jgi:hypothetical protein
LVDLLGKAVVKVSSPDGSAVLAGQSADDLEAIARKLKAE